MSLDLYVKSKCLIKHRGTGVYVREYGMTRKLKTIEEVKAHFPDADTSDINIREWEDDELFHCNMTHNLTEMASHVPIDGTDGVMTLPQDYERDRPDWKPKPLSAYNLLWHPETNPLLKNEIVHRKDDDGEEWNLEVTYITPELLRQLLAVYHYTSTHADELRVYNPENGWGTYEQLRDCTRHLLIVLMDIPVEEYGQYHIYCCT